MVDSARGEPRNVILNTNVLLHLNRVLRKCIPAVGVSLEQLRARFIAALDELLAGLSCHGRYTLYTSDMVYETEVDPRNHNSVLRTEDPDFFGQLCEDEGFVRAAAEIYEKYIRREPILEEDLEELKHSAGKDVGKWDFSLVLLGIQTSQELDAILVTDDTDLTKIVKKFFHARSLEVKGVRYRTNALSPQGVLEFIRDLHRGCMVSNEVWKQSIYALHEHYNARYMKGEITDARYAEVMKLLSPIMSTMARDCREKEARDIGQAVFGSIVEL